jgi:hypothetical protein
LYIFKIVHSSSRLLTHYQIEIELKEPENEPCNEFLFEAFSGAVLTDVHAHFEQKALQSEELGQRGSKIRDDCYRTNAAILRCAGRLPPKAVEGLASHISSKLADLKANIDDDTVHENITPHIALLCLWGMTEDVALSLSASIQLAFGDDNELISADVGDGKRSSNKRRSGRNRTEDLAVPPLPPRVALDVLGDLLRGSVAAREAILSSRVACNAFEMALEMGTVRAERLLQSNPVRQHNIQRGPRQFNRRDTYCFFLAIVHRCSRSTCRRRR